jgi:chemotaxis signal transduction protein
MAKTSTVLLIGRVGDQTVAVPVDRVDRVLRMVALTPLPDAPPHIAGIINLHGELLPVVDLHTRLDVPRPSVHVDQHLLVVTASTRFLVWLDRIETIVEVDDDQVIRVETSTSSTLAPFLMRIEDKGVPILALEELDPGPFLRQGRQDR